MTYSLDWLFIDDGPGHPIAQIFIKTWTEPHYGNQDSFKCITPICATATEFDEQIDRLHKEAGSHSGSDS